MVPLKRNGSNLPTCLCPKKNRFDKTMSPSKPNKLQERNSYFISCPRYSGELFKIGYSVYKYMCISSHDKAKIERTSRSNRAVQAERQEEGQYVYTFQLLENNRSAKRTRTCRTVNVVVDPTSNNKGLTSYDPTTMMSVALHENRLTYQQAMARTCS